jgi:hypothetical protein
MASNDLTFDLIDFPEDSITQQQNLQVKIKALQEEMRAQNLLGSIHVSTHAIEFQGPDINPDTFVNIWATDFIPAPNGHLTRPHYSETTNFEQEATRQLRTTARSRCRNQKRLAAYFELGYLIQHHLTEDQVRRIAKQASLTTEQEKSKRTIT